MVSRQLVSAPRAFFFKYGLRLALPDDDVVDPDTWLDKATSGSLLHELFEAFVRELVEQERFPELARDRERLLQLLAEQVAKYRDRFPPPDEIIFQRERGGLEQTALTFLREDELFCREYGCRPLFLEASFGMAPSGSGTSLDTSEPIPIKLATDKQVFLRGRVDRIDRIGDAALNHYAVWDYKTGSAYGFEKVRPFQQGRKVQSFLYVMMVGHAIRKEVDPSGKVKHFGFFFPGPRTIGQRIEWTPKELTDGKRVLEQLCQVVAEGAFLATDNESDCKFCDYQTICGDQVFEISKLKLNNPDNVLLEPVRQLRAQPED